MIHLFSYNRPRLEVLTEYLKIHLTKFKCDCLGLDWNLTQILHLIDEDTTASATRKEAKSSNMKIWQYTCILNYGYVTSCEIYYAALFILN